MRERMNHSPLIALIFCSLSPSAVQYSHVRRCSCCALRVGVLFILLRNLHMQSRRLGQPLLIESKDGSSTSVSLSFVVQYYPTQDNRFRMHATLLRTQALSPVQLMAPPFVPLTFSKYLGTQILGKRETKAAILEEVLPSTESQGAGITQDGYMMVDKRCVVPGHGNVRT
jgi:hypothetical protein